MRNRIVARTFYRVARPFRKDTRYETHTILGQRLRMRRDAITDFLGLQPDLVKIDVESAEAKAPAGSRKLAEQKKKRFIIEVHSNPDLPMLTNAKLMLSWCESSNYRAWYLKDHAELTSPQQLANRGRCHLLLQPADWKFPEWLKGIEQSTPLQSAQRRF